MNLVKTRSGFTLLEIMVALSIIAIVFLSIFKMHAQTISMTASSRFYSTAPILARNRLAAFLSQPQDDFTDDAGDFTETHPGYVWQIKIQDIESEADSNVLKRLKQIDVKISLNNEKDNYRLRTYRFMKDSD